MVLIDLLGLTSAPINVHTLVKAYNLSGYLLPPERRLGVLKRLRGDATPHLVYTGPEGAEFWRGAPAHIQVRILPGDTELPARRRLKDPPHDFTAVVEDDLQGLQQVGAEGYEAVPYQYKVVDSYSALAECSEQIQAAAEAGTVIGLDTEATSEDDRKAVLVGLGLSFDREHNYYLPVTDGGRPGALALGVFSSFLSRLRYVAHNAKYDYKVLKRAGFPIDQATLVGDGMIAAYVLASVDRMGRPLPKGLKWLAQEYLGVHQPEYKDMMASAGVDIIWDIPLDIIGRYCCGDAYLCIQIEQFLVDKLVDKGLDKIYRQLEVPNVILLAEMELLGLPIDVEAVEERKAEFERILDRLREALNELAHKAGWTRAEVVTCKKHSRKRVDISTCTSCDDDGKFVQEVTFNPNSRYHVAELLQGCLGMPQLKATPGNEASNDRLVLLQLKELTKNDETRTILDVMLAERRISKVLGTYLKPFAEGAVMKTIGDDTALAVIQPRYNQTVVESGRLSSEDPNAQNIPRPLRDLFRAPPGYYIWCADYNQLELRIMASVSRCSAMIEAYARDEDIHALTGWRVFGIPAANLTPEMRVRCKCMAPETRVLTDRLTWKPLARVEAGDRLMAFDEEPGDSPTGQRRLRVTTVTSAFPAQKELYEVEFDDGTILRVTDDHPFLSPRSLKRPHGNIGWKTLGSRGGLKRALKLIDTYKPLDSHLIGWLAGFFDGEGTVGRICTGLREQHDLFNLQVIQKEGLELEKARCALKYTLGFEVGESIRTSHALKPGSQSVALTIKGGRNERLRFLMQVRPERLIRNAVRLDGSLGAAQTYAKTCRVVRVTPLGVGDVISLETESHTFIAEGFAVHNTLNFGVAYEAEAGAVQKQILKAALEHPELNIKVPTIEECRLLIREYWKAYPEVREFREFIHALVEERGYSATLYGRRRYLPLIYSQVPELRARAQRQGWNLVIQGTAGDIVKNAQLLVSREAPDFGADLRCQVHDELWGLVQPISMQDWLARLPLMMGLDQPISPVMLKVAPKVAETWAGAK